MLILESQVLIVEFVVRTVTHFEEMTVFAIVDSLLISWVLFTLEVEFNIDVSGEDAVQFELCE